METKTKYSTYGPSQNTWNRKDETSCTSPCTNPHWAASSAWLSPWSGFSPLACQDESKLSRLLPMRSKSGVRRALKRTIEPIKRMALRTKHCFALIEELVSNWARYLSVLCQLNCAMIPSQITSWGVDSALEASPSCAVSPAFSFSVALSPLSCVILGRFLSRSISSRAVKLAGTCFSRATSLTTGTFSADCNWQFLRSYVEYVLTSKLILSRKSQKEHPHLEGIFQNSFQMPPTAISGWLISTMTGKFWRNR